MSTDHATTLTHPDSRPAGLASSAIAGAAVAYRSIRVNRRFDPTVAA